jgi:serine/threonine-protein kinase
MGDVTAPQEFGSYLVYEQLGVGGMASVHVAESRGLRKRVALKRLLPHAADEPEIVQSFIHEAKLVGHLKHANIAQTYDFGKVGKTYFIAMELVPGPTIGQLIRQCKATVGIIPFPLTLNILCQVCDALAYAHNLRDEHGTPLRLIHRDVSPPNIIVSATGIVKLIDFGVAKNARSGMQTQVGTVKGKFSYMAPEYLNGKLDSRADLWALGAVAYELLTNQMLFDAADDLGVIEKVKHSPLPPPSRHNVDVPRDLDAVVRTALERDPERRWQSAAAMRNALANVATELKTEVTNAQMMEWIEWAFSQKPGEKLGEERSGLTQLIRLLEKPSRPGVDATRPSVKEIYATSTRGSKRGGTDATVPAKRRAAGGATGAAPVNTPRPSLGRRLLSTPRVGAAIVKRHVGSARFFVWLVLLLAAATAAAAAYRYGIPPALTKSI